MDNCEPILDRVKDNKKMIVSAGVRYFRESCCVVESHCVNMGEGGYRRGMLEDLARLREAVEGVQGEGREGVQGGQPG